MGFLGGLGKILKGEPVFQPPTDSGNGQVASPHEAPTSSAASIGPKQIPLVTIERVQCHSNGPNMRVEAVIQNDSAGQLFFDRIFLMDSKTELDRELKPGEEREFTVYNGPRLNHQNYTRAKLEFRDHTNDYFAALFTVDFKQEQDGTYSIERFHSAGQQDI